MKPAIFLDRDGTLNVEKHYLHRIGEWEWTPHAIEALQRFHAAGYALVVVTNQSGIARGYYTAEDVGILHDWVSAQLAANGVPLMGMYYCPHEPGITPACTCRKPQPGMLLRAASEHGLDLARSWMIGDKAIDIEAGAAAGTKTLLVRTGYGRKEAATLPPATPVADHLLAAADVILSTV